ncbi:Uncharacterised protein [Mycobacteroides abscessus subsp. abscessus]|nr:hypothetical protein PROPHIBWHA1_47 [Mycobacterium phage prophiBWHA-1]SHY71251.1 Uncharacterised protein [Mycobacteroides abscessus subsp. abscessus]SHZ93283.1 Uncharacterised protein [Mycobacteroides abscessus subsp. abscessus]SIE08180.1 Uncharacterised protein [Mycobacteroides abscessus subsp. abscessus]SIE64643.1 Uncharacterised protein [Mycobacteroides abscessus subsp. abscessus]
MTTMSVVDVESIVGDMPARVCEWAEEGGPCASEAEWVMRVHFVYPCENHVVAFCGHHRDLVKDEYAYGQRNGGSCDRCGVRPEDVYYEARL